MPKIAIIGAGFVGGAWAISFARAGHQVALWDADAVQAHPLVNTATMILPHADLERFLRATGHWPRVIDVPATGAN